MNVDAKSFASITPRRKVMGTVTQMAQGTEVARLPKILIPLIKEDLANGKEAAKQAGMPYYRAAGEKMLELKPQIIGERWETFVERNFRIGKTQAKEYMALARATLNGQNAGTPEFSSIREFERYRDRDRPTSGAVRRSWTADVDGIVERTRREAERMQAMELTHRQEKEADTKLALRLIDIGYKVLAKELHPDVGGSRDAMQRLTRVRDKLKAHVSPSGRKGHVARTF